MAYWVSEAFVNIFTYNSTLGKYCFPKQGLHTGNNNLYLRLWPEVNCPSIMLEENTEWDQNKSWAKLNKGGSYRKWYGNREYVLLWKDNGMKIKGNGHSVGASNKTFFQNMLGFTDITSYKPSFRYYGKGFIYDVSGPSMFNKEDEISNEYILGILNSKVCDEVMSILSPTIHMNQTALSNISILAKFEREVETIVRENISLSRTDWDSFETSWDFARHPMVRPVPTIKDAYTAWQGEWGRD